MKTIHLPVMAAGLLLAASAWAAQAVDVTIDAMRPGPVINKHLYGQAAVNERALWVGPTSAIPNIKGWRKDAVAALKDLRTPVLSWPGACQADTTNWRDGIGARGRNEVGTHDFFNLVELLGADAQVNGNVGTGSPREAAEWVEYMLADGGSTLSKLRARNGHAQPFKVAYFGVGNAPWGCGGNMTPQYYTDLYNQYAVFIRGKVSQPPQLIASGSDAQWTDELSTRKRIRDYRDRISMHYAGAPAGAGEQRWISTLSAALGADEFIASNVAKLDQNDPANKISLVMGEWGARDGNTLGDALAAALYLHAFHAHAGRLSMASTAQATILTEGRKIVLTPSYHALRMHAPFQDATSLPVKLGNNPGTTLGGIAIPTVSASAARAKDGKLYLSLVNTNPKEAVPVTIAVAGGAASAASGSVLTAGALEARNSAVSPSSVAPAPVAMRSEQGKLLLSLAPGSVTVLAIDAAQ